jgi:hypothetical protein
MRRPEVGILALAMLALACAIPTEMPNWDMTWNLPVPDKGKLSIAVTSFLPSGVDTIGAPTATGFRAAVGSPPPITRTLGADCTSCGPLNGTNAPKPLFTSAPPPTTVTLAAAASLTSGALAAGSQVVFSITNGFNFDPIRPQAGSAVTNTGVMTLTVNNGAATLGTLAILGTASPITANATSTFTLPLAGTVTGTQPLSVTMTMTSPAGSNVTINTAQVLSISSVPTLNISTATVNIGAQAVAGPATPIDLSGLDSAVYLRVPDSTTSQGTLFLTITSPFTVGGSININFAGTKKVQQGAGGGIVQLPITPVIKTLTLPAGTATPAPVTVAVALSGVELRNILGSNLQVTFTGTTGAGSLTVTPTAKITMTSRLQLVLDWRKSK